MGSLRTSQNVLQPNKLLLRSAKDSAIHFLFITSVFMFVEILSLYIVELRRVGGISGRKKEGKNAENGPSFLFLEHSTWTSTMSLNSFVVVVVFLKHLCVLAELLKPS